MDEPGIFFVFPNICLSSVGYQCEPGFQLLIVLSQLEARVITQADQKGLAFCNQANMTFCVHHCQIKANTR
jgi:hypothetical protein